VVYNFGDLLPPQPRLLHLLLLLAVPYLGLDLGLEIAVDGGEMNVLKYLLKGLVLLAAETLFLVNPTPALLVFQTLIPLLELHHLVKAFLLLKSFQLLLQILKLLTNHLLTARILLVLFLGLGLTRRIFLLFGLLAMGLLFEFFLNTEFLNQALAFLFSQKHLQLLLPPTNQFLQLQNLLPPLFLFLVEAL